MAFVRSLWDKKLICWPVVFRARDVICVLPECRTAMLNGGIKPEIAIEEAPPHEPEGEYIGLQQVRADSLSEEEKIVLNVGGVRHETHISTLRNVPNTRLFNLAEVHVLSVEPKDVYFFDRHPAVFNSIIDFYRTGT